MTNYKSRKFNLSEKQIASILSSIETKIPRTFYLNKNTIKSEPTEGSVDLLLTQKECENVLNNKPFNYNLSSPKINLMKKEINKSGSALPALIPIIAAIVAALSAGA